MNKEIIKEKILRPNKAPISLIIRELEIKTIITTYPLDLQNFDT